LTNSSFGDIMLCVSKGAFVKRIFFTLLLTTVPLCAEGPFVNCDAGRSLQSAINHAEPGETIVVTGTCRGPILVARSRLTLRGHGTAIIDGQKTDALTIHGAGNITLDGIEVENGANGIVANAGAHVDILNSSVHDNAVTGLLVEANSSVTLSGGSAKKNGLNGIDVEAAAVLVITGSYTSEANAVFGLNVNGSSSLLLTQANLVVDQNVLGIQIGTSASAFIADSTTKITVQNNVTTGLTIVSGAHMVAFGGTIVAQGNGVHGVSVDSKAGLDLDAAALLDTHGNGGDGVHIEETSVLTLFNTTAFSGAPGTTAIQASNNGGNGLSILTGSNMTAIHQAAVTSQTNKGAGILADNGSGLTLINSTVTGHAHDVVLSFGSRSDITTSTVGSISCDASVISRGTTVCH
jgi:hypothetical protein